MKIQVIKKNMETELFDINKILKAVNKTALRCNVDFNQEIQDAITTKVTKHFTEKGSDAVIHIKVAELHELVEIVLKEISPELAKEYSSFRGYKKQMKQHFEEMLRDTEQLLHNGDNENANRDSYLISAQKSMSGEIFSVRNMLDYELPKDASQAHKDGDIYIHDLRDRLYGSINCCLLDRKSVV